MRYVCFVYMFVFVVACSKAKSEPIPPPPPQVVEKIVEVTRPITFEPKCDIKYEGEKEILDFLVFFDNTLYATHCNLNVSPVCAVVQIQNPSTISELGVIKHDHISNSSIYFLKSKNNVHKLSRSWSNGEEVIVVDMNLKKISYTWSPKGSGNAQMTEYHCP